MFRWTIMCVFLQNHIILTTIRTMHNSTLSVICHTKTRASGRLINVADYSIYEQNTKKIAHDLDLFNFVFLDKWSASDAQLSQRTTEHRLWIHMCMGTGGWARVWVRPVDGILYIYMMES